MSLFTVGLLPITGNKLPPSNRTKFRREEANPYYSGMGEGRGTEDQWSWREQGGWGERAGGIGWGAGGMG